MAIVVRIRACDLALVKETRVSIKWLLCRALPAWV